MLPIRRRRGGVSSRKTRAYRFPARCESRAPERGGGPQDCGNQGGKETGAEPKGALYQNGGPGARRYSRGRKKTAAEDKEWCRGDSGPSDPPHPCGGFRLAAALQGLLLELACPVAPLGLLRRRGRCRLTVI